MNTSARGLKSHIGVDFDTYVCLLLKHMSLENMLSQVIACSSVHFYVHICSSFITLVRFLCGLCLYILYSKYLPTLHSTFYFQTFWDFGGILKNFNITALL